MKTSTLLNSTEAIVSYDRFLEDNLISAVTGWRYRKRGWLNCINIAGRWYIERAEIERFLERARAGDFAKTPACPKRKEASK